MNKREAYITNHIKSLLEDYPEVSIKEARKSAIKNWNWAIY